MFVVVVFCFWKVVGFFCIWICVYVGIGGCMDLNVEKICGFLKIESCCCKYGFVLSGDICVR